MVDSNHCLTQYMHNTFCWMNVWMGHNIMGYRILHWRYFFLSTLELPFTNLLASIIVIRNQPPVKLFLLTNLSFSSSCFKNLFLSPVFCSFIMICLSMDFFFINSDWYLLRFLNLKLCVSSYQERAQPLSHQIFLLYPFSLSFLEL